MKTRKNLLAAIVCITSATLGSFWYATWTDNALPIESMSTVSSCSSVGKMYLNQDNDSDGKSDYYLYLNNNFILNGSANDYTAGQILREAAGVTYTKIKYYRPLVDMVYKVDTNNVPGALDNSTFWRASRVFPYNTPLRWIATTPNKVVFERPSDNDANKNIVSFIYDYKYKYAQWFDGNTSSAYRYNQVPNMNYMDNIGLTYVTTLPWSEGNRKRSRSAVQETSNCKNYELHRCGNGIVETPNAWYMDQFTWEQCDGTAWVPAWYTCTSTCTLQQVVIPLPSCTLTIDTWSFLLWGSAHVTWAISGNYTNTPQLTYTPTTWSINGLPYTVTTANGTRTIIPQHTGAYNISMMVSNSAGQNFCNVLIAVHAPQQLQCTLFVNPNSVVINQPVTIGWMVTGGNFFWTYIYVAPQVGWAWPHQVNANQYTGNTIMIPTQTGNYLFTMIVNNPNSSYTCTGILTAIAPDAPTCSLTTSTPTITQWQTAILNGSYTHATLATITPTIGGLNFLYPNRSNNNILVTPTTTTTYTMVVTWQAGTTPAICQTTIVITWTAPSCILYVAPNAVAPGAQVTIGWNVFWNFLTTQITNTPLNTITGIPYTVAANTHTWSIAVSAPNISGTYLFSMNVTNNFGTSICTWVFTVQTHAQLQLTKTLINNILYHSGDLVSFRIDFANIGNTAVTNAILTDRLPAALTYESSQLYGVNPPYMFGTGINGNNIMVEYSGFSLAVGQTGYMIITWKLKWYNRSGQTLNNVFLDSNETDILYAGAMFWMYTPNANATITKTSDKQIYYPSENVQFIIALTNNGPDTINNVQLTDIWPTNNNSCLTIDPVWTATTPMMMTGTNPYIWTLNTSLLPGTWIYLYLTWHIANNQSCIGTYTNNVNLQYTINGLVKTGHADATIKVIPTPSSTMTIQKNILQYGNASGDPISFELIYYNNGTATISNYDIVDYRPGTLNFTSASPMPASQTATPGGQLLHRYFTTPLAPNGSGRIVINGTIN